MRAFTTADAAERLARKQAAKQLGVGAAVDKGLTVKFEKPNLIAKGYDAVRSVPMPRLSTPVNTGTGVSMGGVANPIQSTVEPARQAGRRAVGDITAIPGVGQPSASPTARDFRAGNYVAPIVDYATLASTVIPAAAKGVSAVRNRPLFGDMARERAAIAARQVDGPKVELPAGRRTAKELNRERRATEIVDEYGVDLDEALIMAEVEDDFRAALIRDADRIASPETRQQFIQWAKSTPIEKIRAQDPNFNSLFVRMSEMGGFGE